MLLFTKRNCTEPHSRSYISTTVTFIGRQQLPKSTWTSTVPYTTISFPAAVVYLHSLGSKNVSPFMDLQTSKDSREVKAPVSTNQLTVLPQQCPATFITLMSGSITPGILCITLTSWHFFLWTPCCSSEEAPVSFPDPYFLTT